MKKYIPADNQDLIKNMKDNNFEGEYFEKENLVYWKNNQNEEIIIILNNQPDEAYIILPNGTHDHVPNDELWKYLCKINGTMGRFSCPIIKNFA